jgi:RNA polymerase-binding transcription factor DksA
MADEADIANDLIANEVLSVLSKMRQQTGTGMGPEQCCECGEKIPKARRSLGFKLCIECAEESERRKSLFAG